MLLASILLLALLAASQAIAKPARLSAVARPLQRRQDRREAEICAKADSSEVSLNPLDLAFCGTFATALGDFLMHPLDTIKIVQQSGKSTGGMFKVARQIFKEEGIAGFYPGVWAYVLGDGLSGAVKFASFEVGKKWLEERTDEKYHGTIQFLCAAGAMLACSVILVPGEVIKCRMQAGTIDNMLTGALHIVKNEGVGGLYQGYLSTMFRDLPYTILELGLYENIKTALVKAQKKKEVGQSDEILAAAITGAFTGWITTPLDVVKTRLMLAEAGASSGLLATFAETYKTGGIDAFFVGVSARVSWILPFTAFYLPVYEMTKRGLLDLKRTTSK